MIDAETQVAPKNSPRAMSPETLEKRRIAMLQRWADPETSERMRAGQARYLAEMERTRNQVPDWVPSNLRSTYRLIAKRLGQEAAASEVRKLKADPFPDLKAIQDSYRNYRVIYSAPIGPRLEGGPFFNPLPAVAANMIVREVFDAAELHPSLFFSSTRIAPVVIARHAAYYRLHTEMAWTLGRIARFSRRDHTSIRNGVLKHAARMKAVAL